MRYTSEDTEIILSDGVLNLIDHYKQTSNRLEKGGILLGYKEGNVIYVEKASIPTAYDRSSKYNFTRNKKSAQLFIDYEYLNSKGKITYIGEWHTHPEKKPSPSRRDVTMIKTQYYNNEFNHDFLVMLIVGTDGNYVAIFNGKSIIPYCKP